MSHSLEHEVSLVILICVLSLFFFPATEGPYPAVHGPVTALQAMRFSVRLRSVIAAAISCALSTHNAGAAGYFFSIAVCPADLGGCDGGPTNLILRC